MLRRHPVTLPTHKHTATPSTRISLLRREITEIHRESARLETQITTALQELVTLSGEKKLLDIRTQLLETLIRDEELASSRGVTVATLCGKSVHVELAPTKLSDFLDTLEDLFDDIGCDLGLSESTVLVIDGVRYGERDMWMSPQLIDRAVKVGKIHVYNAGAGAGHAD